ncbi:MAG: hypothetical protein GWP56_01510 [Gammaproteobacteria bacterium]|jgi:hypothetical protein|nr:hypothetical protein [Gammaproteobacteria bacterium]
MRTPRCLFLLSLLAVCISVVAATETVSRQLFDRLLEESGLNVESRQAFNDVPIQQNPVLAYEHAMRHESGALELRFIVRPLGRIEIEYNDPHNAAPEPNHLFPLLFESLTQHLAANNDTSSNTLSEAEAKEKFNAQWAAVAAFDVDPQFSSEYKNAILLGMHKNDQADAYTLFLYNDPETAKPLISTALGIMSFNPSLP